MTEAGPGSHLAEATRRNLWISYARFLGFISANRQDLLQLRPEARIDRLVVAEYVAWRRRSCGYGMVAVDLDGLRGALRLICPGVDWSWLLTLAKRIKAAAPRKPRKYHLVTSEHLYALGIELMDQAVAEAESAKRISKAARLRISRRADHCAPGPYTAAQPHARGAAYRQTARENR